MADTGREQVRTEATEPISCGAATGPRILCVDLDGALVRSNVLIECALRQIGQPWALVAMPAWILRGRAALSRALAQRTVLDPALLPYNEAVLRYLVARKAAGDRLVLASAADRRIAEAIAGHLGIFDEVVAPDDARDFGEPDKIAALGERFGEQDFRYIGKDGRDRPIRAATRSGMEMDAGAGPSQQADHTTAKDIEGIEPARMPWRPLLKALRPYQWVKNVLVFVPIITANAVANGAAWTAAALAFLAFCLIASGVYLLNDLTDLEADRRHPRKRNRPFASGTLPLEWGLVATPVLFAGGLALGWASGALPALLLYGVLTVLYSAKLKELPLIDIFCLGALYTVRLFAGGEATGIPVSMWLLAFSSFLFLSLATVKRVAELRAVREEQNRSMERRGYEAEDLQFLQIMGICSAFSAGLVLALYVQSDWAAQRYSNPELLWTVVPLIVFWLCRIWLATMRGYMDDDPIVYAAHDWVSRLVAVVLVAIVIVAASAPPAMIPT